MKKHLSLLFLASILFLSSCHKYEDGPLFSFETLKARASQDWKLEIAFKNEIDTVTSQLHFGIKFSKNDAVTYVDTTAPGQIVTEDGTWQFTNNNDDIAMVLNAPGGPQDIKVWYILRIADSQLWVREQIGPDYYEYHLIPR